MSLDQGDVRGLFVSIGATTVTQSLIPWAENTAKRCLGSSAFSLSLNCHSFYVDLLIGGRPSIGILSRDHGILSDTTQTT